MGPWAWALVPVVGCCGLVERSFVGVTVGIVGAVGGAPVVFGRVRVGAEASVVVVSTLEDASGPPPAGALRPLTSESEAPREARHRGGSSEEQGADQVKVQDVGCEVP